MSGTPSIGRSTGRASVVSASPPRGPAAPPLGGGPGQPRTPGPIYRGRGRRPRRWGRILLFSGLAVLVLALLMAGGGYLWLNSVNNDIERTDPFAGMTGDRPAKVVDGALNILMLGSDSRDPDNKSKAGEWRTDTMLIAHIPASHDKVYFISLPRDLYVDIPKSPTNPKLGGTKAKINAAFAWGGLPLTVQAVEGYSGLRMDHVVLIDFGGFKQVVDALDGVDMNIEQDVKSIHPPYRQFKKGEAHLDGAQALDYVRQRYQFPDGDFARMRHQQQFMRAVLDKAASGGTLSNPLKLNSFLKATAKAVTVDEDLSVVDLALQFRGIRGDDLVFYVSPHLGNKRVNGEDVIMPDPVKGKALYDALKNDKAAEWFQQNATTSPTTK
jgi:LCP family protein required for cell wall assembly